MKGLIVKDFCFMIQRGSLLFFYLLMAVIFSFTMDSTFTVSYLSVMGGFLAISTLSYDAADNGYPFLMTLPITAKTYALEKHVFVGMVQGCFWVFAVALQALLALVQQDMQRFLEELPVFASFLLVFFILISVLIPIELKFGVEKSRIVLLVLTGFIIFAFFLGAKVMIPLMTRLNGLDLDLSMLSKTILATLLLLAAVILSVCVACSIHIMEHKEY